MYHPCEKLKTSIGFFPIRLHLSLYASKGLQVLLTGRGGWAVFGEAIVADKHGERRCESVEGHFFCSFHREVLIL